MSPSLRSSLACTLVWTPFSRSCRGGYTWRVDRYSSLRKAIPITSMSSLPYRKVQDRVTKTGGTQWWSGGSDHLSVQATVSHLFLWFLCFAHYFTQSAHFINIILLASVLWNGQKLKRFCWNIRLLKVKVTYTNSTWGIVLKVSEIKCLQVSKIQFPYISLIHGSTSCKCKVCVGADLSSPAEPQDRWWRRHLVVTKSKSSSADQINFNPLSNHNH